MNVGTCAAAASSRPIASAYATTKLGFSREIVLTGVMLSSLVGAITCIVFGSLSDRLGRRPVMIAGSAFAALYALVYFQLLGAGTPWTAVLLIVIGHAIGARSSFGVQPAFYCDIFPAQVRYSAIAFAREVTGAILVGPLPLLATAMTSWFGDTIWPIALMTSLYSVVTLLSVLWTPKAIAADSEARDGVPQTVGV